MSDASPGVVCWRVAAPRRRSCWSAPSREARRLTASRSARCGRPCAGGCSSRAAAATTPRGSSSTAASTASRPPAVVQVRDTADVRAVVRWADRYDVPLVSRSGGHGYSGNSTSTTGGRRRRLEAGRDPLLRRGRDPRPGRAALRRLHRARPPRRHDPRRLLRHGRGGRARARRRDGPRRTLDGAHARSRDQLRRRDRRWRGVGASTPATTSSGRCAAAAGASRSSPRRACAPAPSTGPRSSASHYPRGGREEALADWDALAPQRAARADRDPHPRRVGRDRLRAVPRQRGGAAQADRPAGRRARSSAAPTT